MRVYIPFDDGSSVSFDGESFTVHGRPLDIDANLNGPSGCKAEDAWHRDWEAVVRALESAWRRQRDDKRRAGRKQVYNSYGTKLPRENGDET